MQILQPPLKSYLPIFLSPICNQLLLVLPLIIGKHTIYLSQTVVTIWVEDMSHVAISNNCYSLRMCQHGDLFKVRETKIISDVVKLCNTERRKNKK